MVVAVEMTFGAVVGFILETTVHRLLLIISVTGGSWIETHQNLLSRGCLIWVGVYYEVGWGFRCQEWIYFKPGGVLCYQVRMEKILSDLYIKVDLQQLNTETTGAVTSELYRYEPLDFYMA